MNYTIKMKVQEWINFNIPNGFYHVYIIDLKKKKKSIYLNKNIHFPIFLPAGIKKKTAINEKQCDSKLKYWKRWTLPTIAKQINYNNMANYRRSKDRMEELINDGSF